MRNMMKRWLCMAVVFVGFSLLPVCHGVDQQQIIQEQLEMFNMEQFDNYLEQSEQALLGDRDSATLFGDILQGKLWQDGARLWDRVWQELTSGLGAVAQIAGVVLLCGVLTAFSRSREGASAQMAQGVCVLCCVAVAMGLFSSLAKESIGSVERITTVMRILVPMMAGVLLWSGKALASVSLPVVVLGLCTLINELIKQVFLPVVYGFIALTCGSAAFGEKRFDGFADFLRGFVVWGLGLCLTIFSAIMALQASSLKIADGALVRTVKYTVGSFVPFVGKVLSDMSDIVLGCGGLISSGFGIFGIVLCLVICALPVLRALFYSLVFRLLAAFAQMMGAEEMRKLLAGFATAFSFLFAIGAVSSILFIIGFAMVAQGRAA